MTEEIGAQAGQGVRRDIRQHPLGEASAGDAVGVHVSARVWRLGKPLEWQRDLVII